jgi:hypothetical protein
MGQDFQKWTLCLDARLLYFTARKRGTRQERNSKRFIHIPRTTKQTYVEKSHSKSSQNKLFKHFALVTCQLHCTAWFIFND